MGSVKEQMKPKAVSKDKAGSIFGKMAWKRKKSSVAEEASMTFSDMLLLSHGTIGKLIAMKEGEFWGSPSG